MVKNILSECLLSEMDSLQIYGGSAGETNSPNDINYYCGEGTKCIQCSCFNPIKGGGSGCDINVNCNGSTCS